MVDGPVDGPWINFVVSNGAAVAGHTPRYRKDSRGVVTCEGWIDVTAQDVLTVQFPVGDRPVGTAPSSYNFDYNSTPNGCYVVISNGGVYFGHGGVRVDLSTIAFPTVLR